MTAKLYIEIRRYLRRLILGTEWEGKVYCVGGCCRDELMGEEIKDVDIAVEVPDGGCRFGMWLHEKGLTVGEPKLYPWFSTSMLRLAAFPDDEIEIVQTRKTKYTELTRNNPSLAFGPVKADALLRDLTINALYYDVTAAVTVDVTGMGEDDIRQHRLRTPVDSSITYKDDPLRIMSCIRFACRYGWEIDGDTLRGMYRNVRRLTEVTKPRLHNELNKILTGPNAVKGLRMMREMGIIHVILPELPSIFFLKNEESGDDTVWQRTMKVVELAEPDPAMRLAALFHAAGASKSNADCDRRSARIARKIMKRLKYDPGLIREVTFLISSRNVLESAGKNGERIKPRHIRRIVKECGSRSRFLRLMSFINAIIRAATPGHRNSTLVKTIVSHAESIMPGPRRHVKGADGPAR